MAPCMPWAGSPHLTVPLLTASPAHDPASVQPSSIHLGEAREYDEAGISGKSKPEVELRLARRLAALCVLLRPRAALLLAALAILESVVVAQVGKVAGTFYQIVLDRRPALLAHAMLHAACLYAACVACSAAGVWLSGRLALTWRQRLASALHRRFAAGVAFAQLPPKLDNPDQRMTADAASLCDALGAVARLAAGAPFRVLFYSWLAHSYIGWQSVAAVYVFFWAAAAVQRLVAAPLAQRIFFQEQCEGNLRYSHLRLREYSAEVAAYRGGTAERRQLDAALDAALHNQRQVVNWRAGLSAASKATDYAGALLNYALVAAAVFAGGGGGGGGGGGSDAQFVSNASFMTLALIYAFTEILDLADQASSVAALAARVGELLEALPEPAGPPEGAPGSSGEAYGSGREGALGSGQSREMQPSDLAALLRPPATLHFFDDGVPIELSVHALGPDLQREARRIFPDAPPAGPLLACITFQFAGDGGVDLSLPGHSGAAQGADAAAAEAAASEMDWLLSRLLRWEAAVGARLQAAGPYWRDLVDPRSGMALHGTKGARWGEVAAAHSLLQYERRDIGVCPVIVHPRHGTSAYPATLFTDAPYSVLWAALAELIGSPLQPPAAALGWGPHEALLQLQGVSLETPGGVLGRLIVSDLTLALRPGDHLLVTGPNGAGKSTLLRALCALHPLLRGSIAVRGRAPADGAADGGVLVFVPQRSLAAPGWALWQQLAYPSVDRPPDATLSSLLAAVGLDHLLHRTGGSFDAPTEGRWESALSPGELQRLAVARVLHRRPALALLDEATSAVSSAVAVQLYGLLQAQGVTCVSVGQDTSALRGVHRRCLVVGGAGWEAGAWQLHDL